MLLLPKHSGGWGWRWVQAAGSRRQQHVDWLQEEKINFWLSVWLARTSCKKQEDDPGRRQTHVHGQWQNILHICWWRHGRQRQPLVLDVAASGSIRWWWMNETIATLASTRRAPSYCYYFCTCIFTARPARTLIVMNELRARPESQSESTPRATSPSHMPCFCQLIHWMSVGLPTRFNHF